jgi:hypothetical protein
MTLSATDIEHAKKVVTLGNDEEVAINVNGVRIEVALDGSVKVCPVSNDYKVINKLKSPSIGDVMPDGTIYAGISPDTKRPMYVIATDAIRAMKWESAARCVSELKENGHNDWRLPTRDELNVLLHNRNEIGGFDESGMNPKCWYWSSTDAPGFRSVAWVRRFRGHMEGDPRNDRQEWRNKDYYASVRCIRG